MSVAFLNKTFQFALNFGSFLRLMREDSKKQKYPRKQTNKQTNKQATTIRWGPSKLQHC